MSILPLRILLLEDDGSFAELVQELIFEELSSQWEIVHVHQLQAALEYLQAHSPEVVLTDLNVPDAQGLETLRALHQVAPALPVVVLTGMENLDLGLRALREGAQDYLNKQDINAPLLERSLRYAIERASNQALLRHNEQRLTEIVKARTAQLQREVRRRKVLFDASMDGLVVLNHDGKVVEANPHFVQLLGYDPQEVTELHLLDWIPDRSFQGEMAALVQAQGDNKRAYQGEIQHRRRDGSEFYAEVRVNVVDWDDTPLLLYACRDVSSRKKAAQDLQASEQKHRALVNALPDLVMRIGRDGTYLDFLPPKNFQLFNALALKGHRVQDGDLPPSLTEKRMHYVEKALETGQLQCYEQTLMVNGQSQEEEVRINPISQNEVIAIVRDITERKLAEAALAQSEATNRAIIDAIPDLLIQMDREGIYSQMFAGKAVKVKRPANPLSVVGASLFEILPLELAQQRLYFTWLALASGELQVYEQTFEIGGEQRDEEVRIAPLNHEEVLVIIRDICDRKQAERQLQQLNQELKTRIEGRTVAFNASENRFRGIFEQSPVGIVITDLDGQIVRVNPSLAAMLNTPQSELLEQSIQALLRLDQHQLAATLNPDCTDTPGNSFERLILTKAGSPIWVKVISASLWDGWGRDAGFVHLIDNITSEKAAQTTLEEISSLQQAILNGTDYAIMSTDRDGKIQTFNAGAERLLGYRAEDIVSKGTPLLFHDLSEIRARRQSPSNGGVQPDSNDVENDVEGDFDALVRPAKLGIVEEKEWTYVHRDGHRLPVTLAISALWDSCGHLTGFLCIAKDITSQKQAESALRHSEARYRAIVEDQTELICRFLHDGSITFANQAYCDYFDISCDDLAEQNFWQRLTVDDRLFVKDQFQQLSPDAPVISYEQKSLTVDGEERWQYWTNRAIYNRQGELIEYQAVGRDISDRKQAEAELKTINDRLTLANSELHRATRLKDEFLANMSHELRTPLNAMLGMAEGLSEEAFGTINQRQRTALETIERSGQHLLFLINDILDLSKVEAGKLELHKSHVAINSLCQASLMFVQRQAYKKHIQLSAEIPSGLPEIEIDERRIHQVLINLLTNAVKFTPQGGSIRLRITYSREPKPLLHLSVIDTGIGIAAADIPKLFKPFVQIDSRLNRPHSGTGLGLALVHRLVDLHGGDVALKSTVGEGSCFTVNLPYTALTETPLTPMTTPPAALAPGAMPATQSFSEPASRVEAFPLVLLAEDNDASAASMMGYLHSRGYQVVRAKNGQQVLDLSHRRPPAVILMDIQMPDVDGIEAVRRIRSHPRLKHVPIIALTALAMPKDRAACLAAGVNEYLTKPVRLRFLVNSIQTLISPS